MLWVLSADPTRRAQPEFWWFLAVAFFSKVYINFLYIRGCVKIYLFCHSKGILRTCSRE